MTTLPPNVIALSDRRSGDRAPVTEEWTDEYLARRFVDAAAGAIRYTPAWGKWHRFDGAYWREDETMTTRAAVRLFLAAEAERAREGGAGQRLVDHILSAGRIAAIEVLARCDQRAATAVAAWNADPWLLATPGGTVDLRTGELRPGRPEDLISRCTTVVPAPPGTPCPTWISHLAWLCTDKDGAEIPGLKDFLQRALGYSITGRIIEEVLFYFIWLWWQR
ncbi:MAG: hypothetical protein U1E42_09750 [Rhodospirillales bacterium]